MATESKLNKCLMDIYDTFRKGFSSRCSTAYFEDFILSESFVKLLVTAVREFPYSESSKSSRKISVRCNNIHNSVVYFYPSDDDQTDLKLRFRDGSIITLFGVHFSRCCRLLFILISVFLYSKKATRVSE